MRMNWLRRLRHSKVKFLFCGGAYSEEHSPGFDPQTPNTTVDSLNTSCISGIVRVDEMNSYNGTIDRSDDNECGQMKHNCDSKEMIMTTAANVIHPFSVLTVHNELCASAKTTEIRRKPFPKNLYPPPIPLTDEEEEERQNKKELQREKKEKRLKKNEKNEKIKALEDVREILTKIVVENEYEEEGIDIEENDEKHDQRNNMDEDDEEEGDDDEDDDDDDEEDSDEEKDGVEGKTEEEVKNDLLSRLIYSSAFDFYYDLFNLKNGIFFLFLQNGFSLNSFFFPLFPPWFSPIYFLLYTLFPFPAIIHLNFFTFSFAFVKILLAIMLLYLFFIFFISFYVFILLNLFLGMDESG